MPSRFFRIVPLHRPAFLLLLLSCSSNDETAQLTYVGRDRCVTCHEAEATLYHGSDHDLAMDRATDSTVLGDFSGARVTLHGITSEFRKRGEKFLVTTEGADGRQQEFEITYVFGFRPLQQYLVAFADGSVQCLPYAWDTRTASEGGQRWFHVYGDQRIAPENVLFWTRASQRWNYMCAECHSTNLRKNFDADTRTYQTTWSEIDVSCEACHGPGSLHISLTEGSKQAARASGTGFPFRLSTTETGTWNFSDLEPTAQRTPPREADPEVDLCARCHSRRSIISEEYVHGEGLENTHYPSLLREDLYYDDGQIRDEVYEYGSFLQSRMYQEGVVCTDCHDAHSTRVYADGNALCFRCHKAEVFDAPSHSLHSGGEGMPECVDCHMPETTYMVVDPRRDHSFRVPRPDLSRTIGSPNPCATCHQDRSDDWAERRLEERYGPQKEKHYGETFSEARKKNPAARAELIDLFGSKTAGPMVRGTALSLLSLYRSEDAVSVITAALSDPDPIIKSEAIASLQMIPPDQRVFRLTPLLSDSVLLVRTLAARALAGISPGVLSGADEGRWRSALDEYEATQELNSDFPSALLNLANLNLELGDPAKAEEYLRRAIRSEPAFAPAYVNLADLYRAQGREDDAIEALRTALEVDPADPVAHHAIGLAYFRRQERDSGLVHLARSVELGPGDPRNAYVYGVGLHSAGKVDKAVMIISEALAVHPYDSDLLELAIHLHREMDEPSRVLYYAGRLRAVSPGNRLVGQVEREFGDRSGIDD